MDFSSPKVLEANKFYEFRLWILKRRHEFVDQITWPIFIWKRSWGTISKSYEFIRWISIFSHVKSMNEIEKVLRRNWELIVGQLFYREILVSFDELEIVRLKTYVQYFFIASYIYIKKRRCTGWKHIGEISSKKLEIKNKKMQCEKSIRTFEVLKIWIWSEEVFIWLNFSDQRPMVIKLSDQKFGSNHNKPSGGYFHIR